MDREVVIIIMLMLITLMLLSAGAKLDHIGKLMKGPRLIVPDDLDLSNLKPGPIVWERPQRVYKRGDRVRVTQRSGFNRGAVGVVEFQEPNDTRCWVIRDGAGSPCWFTNHELEPETP